MTDQIAMIPASGDEADEILVLEQKVEEMKSKGHTITAIFDPSADTETGFISCFAELQEAAEFLIYKRGR